MKKFIKQLQVVFTIMFMVSGVVIATEDEHWPDPKTYPNQYNKKEAITNMDTIPVSISGELTLMP